MGGGGGHPRMWTAHCSPSLCHLVHSCTKQPLMFCCWHLLFHIVTCSVLPSVQSRPGADLLHFLHLVLNSPWSHTHRCSSASPSHWLPSFPLCLGGCSSSVDFAPPSCLSHPFCLYLCNPLKLSLVSFSAGPQPIPGFLPCHQGLGPCFSPLPLPAFQSNPASAFWWGQGTLQHPRSLFLMCRIAGAFPYPCLQRTSQPEAWLLLCILWSFCITWWTPPL